jgi:hypothetical protein
LYRERTECSVEHLQSQQCQSVTIPRPIPSAITPESRKPKIGFYLQRRTDGRKRNARNRILQQAPAHVPTKTSLSPSLSCKQRRLPKQIFSLHTSDLHSRVDRKPNHEFIKIGALQLVYIYVEHLQTQRRKGITSVSFNKLPRSIYIPTVQAPPKDANRARLRNQRFSLNI